MTGKVSLRTLAVQSGGLLRTGKEKNILQTGPCASRIRPAGLPARDMAGNYLLLFIEIFI